VEAHKTMTILGGTGFIGGEVVAEAVGAGWHVNALTRSPEGARKLEAAGAHPVEGKAEEPGTWAKSLRGSSVVIDLVQPGLPGRLTKGAIEKVGGQRLRTTRGVIAAIEAAPEGERPVLVAVSGVDDLQPDASGVVVDDSPVATEMHGFAPIGVPVRRAVEGSGVDATFVYFGALVYGAGKVYADLFVDGLKRKRAKILGSGENHLSLTHVRDAAGFLVHLADLPRGDVVGRTFLAADGADSTQRELLEETARLMGVKAPGSVPAAIASLVAGKRGVETLTRDIRAHPAAVAASGYDLRFPSYREGVPEALAKLGALA
jgi:nucleoside-diphosphate-sugar epimerase